jgi:protein SCO1/2
MRSRNLIIAFVLGAAIAAGLATALRMNGEATGPIRATVLPAGNELPQFTLLDDNGNTIDRSVFTGQWDLVFFGFTHCPDICPTTLQTLARVGQQLAERGQDPMPRIVLVSVDPERDTPEIMARYVSSFGDDILGITGSLDEIGKLTDALGIYFAKTPVENGNYSVDHSTVVMVINPQGHFQALFGAPHRVEEFLHDLPLVMVQQ